MGTKHILKIAFFSLGVFTIASAAVLGGTAYAYKGKFYPGVKVGGVAVGGKTYQEGSKLVAEKVAAYSSHPFKVTFPDIAKPRDPATNRYPDLDIATKSSDLGVTFNDSQALASAWSQGHVNNPLKWLPQAIPVFFQGYTAPLSYSISQAGIQAFIGTQVVPKITTPTPAKISLNGTEVSVTPPQPGLDVKQEELATQLAKAIDSTTDADPTYLRAPVQEIDSPVTAAVVQPIADQLDKIGNVKVALTATNFSVTPARADLLKWFTPVQDDKGAISLVLQQDAVSAYLKGYKQLDQAASLTTLTAALAPLTTTPVAQAAPSNKLAVALKAAPVVSTTVQPGAYTPGKFEGRYVEVNLHEQRMYLIDGTTLDKTYVISSGKWSTPTPTGVFSIHSKSPRAYSASFGLYMPYWQNFLNGEYGLHELPEWPNGYKEGQNHLGTPVSHGCVRLGVGDAKEVYEWTSIGTPVYIH